MYTACISTNTLYDISLVDIGIRTSDIRIFKNTLFKLTRTVNLWLHWCGRTTADNTVVYKNNVMRFILPCWLIKVSVIQIHYYPKLPHSRQEYLGRQNSSLYTVSHLTFLFASGIDKSSKLVIWVSLHYDIHKYKMKLSFIATCS